MVVGGEWFAMWQSEHWNGQQTAFRIYLTVLAVLIFIQQQDGDLALPPPSQQTAPKRRRTDV
jgi:predicted small integral membrane protein